MNVFVALGGTRPEDDYNEANKRHTMSHPPEHIPNINNQSPAKVKSPKEKKEKKEKVGVFYGVFVYARSKVILSRNIFSCFPLL